MKISRKELKAEAETLRKQAQPVWKALEGDEDCERHRGAFESSLAHFEQQRLCITVMGEFNTGKSTLLNAFIGENLLATDLFECTAVPTWVRWSDEEQLDEDRPATVVYANGGTDAVPLSEVSARTTLDEDAWEAIERVEIVLPAESKEPKTSLVLVDTPGLNGKTELEARSIHQLGMSHVTIVVVPVNGIGRQSDIELIKKARSIANRVLVVINKCDQYAKSGNGFEHFREELHKRVAQLDYKDIYTLSAKRAFEGGAYLEGEEELEDEEYRFIEDLEELNKGVLKGRSSALKRRPLSLLREICKAEIARIEKREAEFDRSVSKELEAAEARLDETAEDLQRTGENILRLARKTLMGELGILQSFLSERQPGIEQEMRSFVDGLEAKLIERDDLRVAQKAVSDYLNESLEKPVFDRIHRLLKASANRLVHDLENHGQVSALDLQGVASVKLDMAPLKLQVDKANKALSRRENEIGRLKGEVARCEGVVRKGNAEIEDLERQSVQLGDLRAQRKQAVSSRTQLGPKPTPEIRYYTVKKTKKVKRGGLGIADFFFGKKKKKVKVTRSRKDYSRVEEWERKYERENKKVANFDQKIEPIKNVPKELQKASGELQKLQRDLDNSKARLRREEARFAEEKGRYRQSGIKTRQAQLKIGARRELESLFNALSGELEQGAEQMLEEISRDFDARFKDASDRQHELLANEIKRTRAEARAKDAERTREKGVRETLSKALETFRYKDQGELACT